MRSTKLSATTKLSAEHETPPIANVLLPAGLLRSLLLCRFIVAVSWCVGLVALLDFFSVGLCGCKKNTNVPPNALAKCL